VILRNLQPPELLTVLLLLVVERCIHHVSAVSRRVVNSLTLWKFGLKSLAMDCPLRESSGPKGSSPGKKI